MSEYIKTVFLDIGSVLLTNGWDRKSRKLASAKFNLPIFKKSILLLTKAYYTINP